MARSVVLRSLAYFAQGVSMLVGAVMNGGIAAAGGGILAGASVAAGVAAMAGLALVGAGFVYLSQKEYTKLRVIQDEHLAEKNAQCAQGNGLCPAPIEHEQNQRADGKHWTQVVSDPHSALSLSRH